MNNDGTRIFLTAEWRHLAMLNYEIEPSVLAPYVPRGTELDLWNGKSLISAVGFLFVKTRVGGIPIPFHRNFEEVNLRIYVRRNAGDGWRRGVVFIKEIVPRAAIALTARTLYNEPYVALPMAHHLKEEGGRVKSVEYSWWFNGRPNRLELLTRGGAQPLVEGSEAEFITEHYWGYNSQRDGSTWSIGSNIPAGGFMTPPGPGWRAMSPLFTASRFATASVRNPPQPFWPKAPLSPCIAACVWKGDIPSTAIPDHRATQGGAQVNGDGASCFARHRDLTAGTDREFLRFEP